MQMAQKGANAKRERRRAGSRPRVDPELVFIGEDLFAGATRSLIDECIVPALVDAFLRSKRMLPNDTNDIVGSQS
jgi:hypothetical protein